MKTYVDTNALILAHLHRVDQLVSEMSPGDPLSRNDDARQEGYVRLAEKAAQWIDNPRSEFWTFVYLDVRKFVVRALEGYPDVPGEPIPDRAGPDTTKERELGDQIARLPGRLQPVAQLLAAGYSERQVSKQLRLGRGAIQFRVNKIRQLWRSS